MQLSFKKCFECDWSIIIGKILIGSCKQEVVNFFEELHKNIAELIKWIPQR